MIVRKLSTFACAKIIAQPYFERPTPLVFIAGEGYNKKIWDNTIKYCSDRGFHGLSLELPDIDDLDLVLDNLNRSIQNAKLNNPIIIANSIATFCAQKYLESYSAKALVLIHPIPPEHHMKHIIKIIDDSNKSNKKKYPNFIRLITNESKVNIEPGACEMLVITSKSDNEDKLLKLKSFHKIPSKNIYQMTEIDDFVSFSTNEIVHSIIYDFIDTIY